MGRYGGGTVRSGRVATWFELSNSGAMSIPTATLAKLLC
jgi:hypothetical protein